MRHPETSFQLHGAGTSRHRSKHARGALVALAALLFGTATLCAQEAGTSDLRPAAPTLPGSSTPEATAPGPQPTSPGTSPRVVAPPPSVTPPAQPDIAATPAPSAAPGSNPAPATVPPETAPSASPGGTANTPPVAEPAAATQATSTPAASDPATTATATLPHDLSPWGMFMAADIIVKSVMLGLAFASVVTWTIWLAKALELFAARVKARRALRCLERATTLAEATETGRRWPKRGPVAALAQAALLETSRSDGLDAEGVKERAAVALHRIEARAGRTMSRGTGLLATIGSTAPFVGLFGTVWGIMNSFIGISQANTTNLAVVAPGIAEALLATAIGLVAAIPAVIIYNVFARSIAGYRAVLADASAEILRHLSRDLDRGARRAQPAAGPSVLQAAE